MRRLTTPEGLGCNFHGDINRRIPRPSVFNRVSEAWDICECWPLINGPFRLERLFWGIFARPALL
jgi:hypothetical protein